LWQAVTDQGIKSVANAPMTSLVNIPQHEQLEPRVLSHLADIEVDPLILHPTFPLRKCWLDLACRFGRPTCQVVGAGIRKYFGYSMPSKPSFARHYKCIARPQTNDSVFETHLDCIVFNSDEEQTIASKADADQIVIALLADITMQT
jgi:hypothetical protein